MRNLLNRALPFTAAILLFLGLITPSLHARTFSDIVAFGDSLTDHNGLSAIPGVGDVPEAWTNCPATGPCVWVEYMAENWGADVDNHAIGGAMTKGHESEALEAAIPFDLGLVGQVDRYVLADPSFDPDETLFAVWIGGNDLLELLRGEAFTGDPEVLINDAMGNISEALNDLEDAGAEQFLVLSVPDISKSPYFAESTPAQRTQVQNLAQNFNSALELTVKTFEATHPGVTVYRFNVFSYLNSLIAERVFVNTTGTYLTLDASGQPTGGVNGDASDYLFWDLIHPTTRAHGLLGNEVANQIEDDDDDSSSCFISTAAGHSAGASAWMALMGFVFAGGVTVFRRLQR